MASKSNPGKWDCYSKAEPDEPLFVLLARDRHAPILVELWAAMRRVEDEDAEKLVEAEDCARAMRDYAKSRGRKVLDFEIRAQRGKLTVTLKP